MTKGKLKILEFVKKSKDRKNYYLCQCECGNKKVIRQDHINKDILSCGCTRKKYKREESWHWKRNPSYGAIHVRLIRYMPKIAECVYCGENERRLEWASIYHKPDKNLDNYIPLCASCHRKYDMTEETKQKIMKNLRWVK